MRLPQNACQEIRPLGSHLVQVTQGSPVLFVLLLTSFTSHDFSRAAVHCKAGASRSCGRKAWLVRNRFLQAHEAMMLLASNPQAQEEQHVTDENYENLS